MRETVSHPVDLVDLAPTWKQCLFLHQLSKDAADGPHVDCGGVFSRAKEEFRRAVISLSPNPDLRCPHKTGDSSWDGEGVPS